MNNYELIINTIELKYKMNSILSFNVVCKDRPWVLLKILPKKAYRKYFFVIKFKDESTESMLIPFHEKEDYKKAIFRLHYLLDTKYRKN